MRITQFCAGIPYKNKKIEQKFAISVKVITTFGWKTTQIIGLLGHAGDREIGIAEEWGPENDAINER